MYATFPWDKSVYKQVSQYPTHVYVLKHLKNKISLIMGRVHRFYLLITSYFLWPNCFQTKDQLGEV